MRLADFGQMMKKYRQEHNMTQEILADILGVQTKHISFLENGHRNPSPELQKNMEDLIMTDEIGEALLRQEKILSEDELTVQIKLYHKLCKIPPVQRAKALEMVYQLLDALARTK